MPKNTVDNKGSIHTRSGHNVIGSRGSGRPTANYRADASYNADKDIGNVKRASATSTSSAIAMGKSYLDKRPVEREESKSGYAGMSTGGSAAGKRLGMNGKSEV